LAAFPDKERILLHIAGRVKDKEALDRKIGALGLKGIVKLHGYLSESALAQLLDRAHLSVNLRWPSMGEASGSQLRFWNHSLPTIATATGWYAAQPEGTLHLVRPEYEREDLHRLWKAALDDYSAFAQTGFAGRKLLESRHSAEVFAAALSDFLPTVAAYRSRAFAPVLAERAGAAASAFGLEAGALDLLSHSTGRAIADLAGLSVQRTAP
ncbi:MAG TPA: hypothetical protein PKI32_04750, partial [Opitutales bacterium]|nr:hypothetical protein [Opitutales bacterium]